MNKIILLSLILFLIVIPLASAAPVIDNVSVNPQQLWLGEYTVISLSCFDNESKTITGVYADITGPSIILPRLNFTGNNLIIDKSYLDRTGDYNANLVCNNNESQTATVSTSFKVSKLTGYISSINPNPSYIGDETEIDFLVKKDGTPLSYGVNFNITLNDQLKQLKIPPAYDLIKGWILKIDSPSAEGTYNVKVYASYDRTSISNTSSLDVKKKIEFSIVSLSKNWVKGNENISFVLRAKDGSNIIDVNRYNFNVQISSINLDILEIVRTGDVYYIKITTPAISAGSYNMIATLNYNGNYYSATQVIDYIVSLNGKIVDNNNKGINTDIKFFLGNVEKLKLSTDSAGSYSGSLPPGTYDVELSFPESTLYLRGSAINDFEDPIKYFYSIDPLVPGIRNAGLFSYEIALTYSEAEIEMNYDEENVFDETSLITFKCSSWNSGRKICNSNWTEIGSDIDTVRNLANVNLNSLSAFIIGERKSINANFNLDKEKYYINDVIKLRGLLKDSDGDTVPNATIKVYLKNTQISLETTSDNNGVFTFELKAPSEEGNYILSLNAVKNPYISFSSSKSFDVFRNRIISIIAPDTIKLKQGQNFTQEFSIVNTGQADLSSLNLSIKGVPPEYYNLTTYIESLKINEENKIYVQFSIPEDAEKKTYGASLVAFNNDVKEEKIFGFTVIDKNEVSSQASESPAGRFILPKVDTNTVYLAIFAIACFSIAAILKKIKIKRSKRDDIKDSLSDIKNSLRKKNIPLAKSDSDYKELISSVFPDALKTDKHGKNN